MSEFVYGFGHPHAPSPRARADLLGGKGANLAEMTSVLRLPVPPGFTITTEACRAYLADGAVPAGLWDEVDTHLAQLEAAVGRRFGDPDDPMLVSVRSGAKFSMPGMMDTVLNLGLTPSGVDGLASVSGDRAFADDAYRRLTEMYEKVVTTALPADPRAQLRGAIEAVFASWNSERAKVYRRREGISEQLGTAVNVQVMVFGNRGRDSGTGVAFTRDPATGEDRPYGDFLVNAQGEDVVSGVRVTESLDAMAGPFPEAHAELLEIFDRLEAHWRDVLDVEFTVEDRSLWMLQVRVGKRTGIAAVRIACDMVDDPTIALSHAEALLRITPEHVEQVLHPQARTASVTVLTAGLGASPGAAVGAVVLTAEAALDSADRGEKVILVRAETSPEDVAGMEVAEGILTSRGGLVSHAAVVARGWGKPAVVGAEEIEVGADHLRVGDTVVPVGTVISIDGTTGTVALGAADIAEGTAPPQLELLLGWADEARAGHLMVRANAETAADAARARAFGAEGIGLCRTEHMFLAEDRLPVVRRMILATTPEEEQAALDALCEVQRIDFVGVLEAMDGLPVTVRLLDPPLHEFLPDPLVLAIAEAKGELDDHGRALLAAARSWEERNPMLGVRGVRLAVLRDGLYRMQARALAEAMADRLAAGGAPIVEVMIPLVVDAAELALARGWVDDAVAAVGAERGVDLHVEVGTMVETPRAALVAAELARHADFFSFGTNDLTQMTFGFSRDDVGGRLLDRYRELGLLRADPFAHLDPDGVGRLVEMAASAGKAANPSLRLAVCGEHGGDPESIAAFLAMGIDEVSCSPFRVPIARLAAAQAVLRAQGHGVSDTR